MANSSSGTASADPWAGAPDAGDHGRSIEGLHALRGRGTASCRALAWHRPRLKLRIRAREARERDARRVPHLPSLNYNIGRGPSQKSRARSLRAARTAAHRMNSSNFMDEGSHGADGAGVRVGMSRDVSQGSLPGCEGGVGLGVRTILQRAVPCASTRGARRKGVGFPHSTEGRLPHKCRVGLSNGEERAPRESIDPGCGWGG